MTKDQIAEKICEEACNLDQIASIVVEAANTITQNTPAEIRQNASIFNAINMLFAASRLASSGNENLNNLELAVNDL